MIEKVFQNIKNIWSMNAFVYIFFLDVHVWIQGGA